LLPLLRNFLHFLQDGEENARLGSLMPLFNLSTQQLRLLHQKAVEKGEVKKKRSRAAVEQHEEREKDVEKDSEERPKKRAAPEMKSRFPLKTAMVEFADDDVYKDYVLPHFRKGTLPKLVSNMKANPESDSSSLEVLRVVCKEFLSSLKNVVDDLKSRGRDDRYVKERADEWFARRNESFEQVEFPMVHCLKALKEVMDREPRPSVKKEVGEVAEAEVVSEIERVMEVVEVLE
jgi:hypothetical protein